jgi:hypothetical protein
LIGQILGQYEITALLDNGDMVKQFKREVQTVGALLCL